jgi:gamma-tubulin complex component 2
LLLRDQALLLRLRSLKRFFFLSQSSFLTHFLDLAHSELRKSARAASLVKLQSLLELSLNTGGGGSVNTSANVTWGSASASTGGIEGGKGGESDDALFREDVRVGMAASGLYEWLLKVVSVTGVLPGGDDGGADGVGIDAATAQQDEPRKDKEKDEKKQILGACLIVK